MNAAAAAAEQRDSLSAAARSCPVRRDNRAVAAGAMNRTLEKNGKGIGDGDGADDDNESVKIVETTPGPHSPDDAGGPVRKTGENPEGSDDETTTGQNRDGLLRSTWRAEHVTLIGPITLTLEETRHGKPYPGRKVGEFGRECNPCASARRDSKGTDGKPGLDRKGLSSDEVDRISSSDEESDSAVAGGIDRRIVCSNGTQKKRY